MSLLLTVLSTAISYVLRADKKKNFDLLPALIHCYLQYCPLQLIASYVTLIYCIIYCSYVLVMSGGCKNEFCVRRSHPLLFTLLSTEVNGWVCLELSLTFFEFVCSYNKLCLWYEQNYESNQPQGLKSIKVNTLEERVCHVSRQWTYLFSRMATLWITV